LPVLQRRQSARSTGNAFGWLSTAARARHGGTP
jgi:hypothetical protein